MHKLLTFHFVSKSISLKRLNHFPKEMTGCVICREGSVFWLPLQNFCQDCPRHVFREEDALPRSPSVCCRTYATSQWLTPRLLIAQRSESFMALLNGKIIDDRTLEERTDGLFCGWHLSDCQLNACHGVKEQY